MSVFTALVRRLRKGRRKIPLRFIIVLPFVVQIFAAVGLTGYLSWRNGSRAVSELANQLSQEVANQIEQHLETFAQTSHLFLAFNETSVGTGALDVGDFEQLERSFWQQTQLNGQVTTLYFGSAGGDFLQIERGSPSTLSIRDASTAPNWNVFQLDDGGKPVELLQTKLYDPRERPWYKAAVAAEGATWSPIYLFAEPPVLGITPARPLYDREGKLLGVIAIDLTLEQINTFLGRLEVGKSGQIFTIEQTGEMVASSDRDLIAIAPNGKRLNAIAHPNPLVRETAQQLRDRFGSFAIDSPQQLSLNLQGQHHFVQVIPLRDEYGLDWLAIALVPKADFMEQIRANTRTTILLCIASLGLATLVGIYTSRRLLRPIRRFVRTSEALARQAAAEDFGNSPLDGPVPESRINEFGALASSMNQMIGQLKSSQIQLGQKVEQRNEQLQQQNLHRLAAEEKFAKVFRSSPDPIVIASLKDGRFLEVNDSFLASSGYTLEEVLGRTAAELNLWAAAGERSHVWQKFKRDRSLRNIETRFQTKSGDIRAILLSAEIFDLDGEECVLYIASDITDRVKGQNALAEAEARYRSIFENAAEGIFQVTPEGKFLSANPALARMYGYESPEELIDCLSDLDRQFYVQGADRQRFSRLMAKQGKVSNFEYQVYRRDRRKIWVSENARAVKDEAGHLLYYEGTIENITRRKLAEAALKEKERYLRLVLDNIPQQVFWKDRNSVFLGCNKNWADAAQLVNPKAVVGLTDADLLPPKVAARFQENDRHIMENNQPEFHAVEMKQKQGKEGQDVWLDISKLPINDEEGEVIGILGVVEDITLRKQSEEELREEKERSEALLRNILPAAIANRLKEDMSSIAEQFDEATILFADIVGFTPLSARMPATELVNFLNQIVSKFDELASQHGLEKIKTIGDAYMVAGGLPVYREDHAEAIAAMALDMQQSITKVSTSLGEPLQIRIGINTGPVVAGVIGVAKFIYDLWGDTVNVASRMESSGLAGKIQVSAATYRLLQAKYGFEPRGRVAIKGKGEMSTYWLTGRI